MASRHMKSTLHHMSSGKCKLEQQLDITTHLLEWQKSKTLTTANAGKDVVQQELSFTAGGNAKCHSHFGRIFWQFLTKLNILFPYDSAISLLGIYPKIYIHTKICAGMFIEALFKIVEAWKQPSCLSTGECIKCGTCKQQNIVQQ